MNHETDKQIDQSPHPTLAPVAETPELFESRKADHIRLALSNDTQALGGSGLQSVRLRHEALPDINFDEVSLEVSLLGKAVATPMFVSSMTAGHAGSGDLNLRMARVCEKRNWPMGVGSQRRQLTDENADLEWKKIRQTCQGVRFLGNIGLAQVISTPVDAIRRLCDTLEAEAMFVHLNPLQECMQPEGTPQFKGGLKALETLTRELGLPVIVKETGSGFSGATLNRLRGIGLFAVDVSGLGGTHWGRVEGGRSTGLRSEAADTFRDWGIGTVESLLAAVAAKQSGADYEVWASGGVRSGLDVAKLVALGAKHVGLAQPVIAKAIESEEALDKKMELLEFELRTALFCTGAKDIETFRNLRVWEI
ncbi:MAG: type 2 isopentenyl-diphosphate Delta-isomerase [Proteobacteria bacterium]|nr:MAG: type 2 isopentenyl-diphosphate Delta-isomerase [Pseudomonadota bacterium]